MISSEAPQSGLANLMAMKGRYGDTELVHMSRPEVQGLASLGKVTINPDTGLPEAFKLGGIFKTIIPMAATAVGGFFGGPMGAAAGNALGQFAVGERDIGKLALGAMMTYGMGAMSASSGTAAAGATGSSAATTGTNAAANTASTANAGFMPDGVDIGGMGLGSGPSSVGTSNISNTFTGLGTPTDPYNYANFNNAPSSAVLNTSPSSVASALKAPTYNIPKSTDGWFGTDFGKVDAGTYDAAGLAKQGVTTIKTPDGYLSASDIGMKGTDYAKAHFSSPSTLIGGGLSAISNGVFEEEQPEYKENKRIPYKPKNLKLISDPNTGKHRYIEITDEEAQQSRFAAEGGLIGLDNGGYVSRVNTFLNPERVQNTDPLGESLDGLQSLSSDMNIGSTSLLEPTASMQPRTLDINTDKTAVNNGGLTLEEFGNGQHRYTRNDPLVETVIGSSVPSPVQGVPDDISDNADTDTDAGDQSDPADAPDSSETGEDGDESNGATGGLISILKKADGGIVSLAGGKRPVSEKDSKNKNSFNLKDFNSIIELGVGYPELKKMLDGETAASKSIAKRLTATNPDSGAKGIFQFIPDVAKDLGTSTAKIEKMTVKEQADLYAKYLKWWKYKPGTPLGMMQAAPAHTNKPDDFIVYKKGSEAFKQNHGWIGDDGEITVGSIKRYYNPVKRPRPKDKPAELLEDSGLASIEVPTFDNTKAYATGGGIGGYFEGQVDGRGNGMSDEIPFEVEGNDPDKALLSRDEYVIPADAVAMLGNGSSNGGAERLDGFIKQLREQSFGTQEQQQPIERQQGLSGLA